MGRSCAVPVVNMEKQQKIKIAEDIGLVSSNLWVWGGLFTAKNKSSLYRRRLKKAPENPMDTTQDKRMDPWRIGRRKRAIGSCEIIEYH